MMTTAPAVVGMRLEDVDTPALILDLDAFETNLKRLTDAVGDRVRVRTHAKTHKCPEIGKRQIAAAAPGLGDKLLLVPGHCDPTVNLYDWYVCIRGAVC